MRLFVAVDVPDGLKARIESNIVERLRLELPGARWTRPEGRHLTLKFLGNVADERLSDVARVVEGIASTGRAFEARFSDVGAFPNLKRPRVLWVGVGEGNVELAEIASRLEQGFVPLGFEAEDRPFRGHFTLARFPKPTAVDLPAIDVPDEPFLARELILFESKLHPKGARYSAVSRFEFS